jgi:hypothetical protein
MTWRVIHTHLYATDFSDKFVGFSNELCITTIGSTTKKLAGKVVKHSTSPDLHKKMKLGCMYSFANTVYGRLMVCS